MCDIQGTVMVEATMTCTSWKIWRGIVKALEIRFIFPLPPIYFAFLLLHFCTQNALQMQAYCNCHTLCICTMH